MKKKVLSVIAALSLALTSLVSLAVTASAETVSGTVGTASYTINDGVLTIGSGSFTKEQWRAIFITTNSTGTPTGAKNVAKSITKVTFEQGATATSSAAGMFYGWTALQEADLSNLNTSNVTDMWSMFKNCSSLKTVDLSGLNTTNVTYMDQMFYSCKVLTSLDLSTFNTKNVTTMNSMFYYCRALEGVTFGDDFDTSKVTDMYGMFYACDKLKTLDLSRFSTGNVTKMGQMFYTCEELTTIVVGSGWNTDKVTSSNSSNMFGGCTKLMGGAGTTYNSTYKDKTYAKVDGGEDDPGYLTAATKPATATYANVCDYPAQFDGDEPASAWKVTVTPGTDAITSLDVKVNGNGSDGALTGVNYTGAVLVAIAVNHAAAEINAITAVVNDSEVATTAVVE